MLNTIDYLQAMGIPIWRLKNSAVFSYYHYEFYDETQEQPIGILLADASLANAAEKSLVDAIAKAIKKRFVDHLQQSFTLPNYSQARAIILLGERVKTAALKIIGNHPVVISYSPAELLANEKLKTHTWGELKKAMQLMG